jgi:hypothetical protein
VNKHQVLWHLVGSFFTLRCRENLDTRFVFSNPPPPEICAVYGRIWKIVIHTDRTRMAIWRMRIAWWITHATNTCNNHFSSTTAMVTRTRLSHVAYFVSFKNTWPATGTFRPEFVIYAWGKPYIFWSRPLMENNQICDYTGCTLLCRRFRRRWGLRRGAMGARLLRLWVRIPQGAWMSVCSECCVLSGRGLCVGLITRPEESYRLWCVVVCDLETSWLRRSWPTGGGAKNKYIYVKTRV